MVVPSRNAARSLPALLDALAEQGAPGKRVELIVVDDGSVDATREIVRSRDRVRLVRAAGHVGVAASRNLGIGAAKGEVLAFLDADCLPLPTWMQCGTAAIAKLEADILAGPIEVALGRPLSVALVDLTQYFDQKRYVSEGFAATGNLWVRREVFERTGLFDERLSRGEDKEFVSRAVAAGARLCYTPDMVVSHPSRGLWMQVRRCFRIGEDRRLAGLRARTRSGAYVSEARARERVAAAGYRPTAGRMLAIRLTKNLSVRLPMAVGALWGGLKSGRRAGGVRISPRRRRRRRKFQW